MGDRLSDSRLSRRRFVQGAVAAGAVAFPMINLGRYAVAGAQERTYSARAVELVQRALVIDMLGIPRIDFRPEAYSEPLSEAEAAAFRSSGINAIHNAVGLSSRDDALSFLAAQQGFAGRQPL